MRRQGATFAVRPSNAPSRPDAGGSTPPTPVLFGRIYLLFPTRQFRCYFEKIPLLFRCSQKRRFGSKPLKSLAKLRAIGPGFFKNSLLIPLLPQIAKRFQRDASARGDPEKERRSIRFYAAIRLGAGLRRNAFRNPACLRGGSETDSC
jgi:hypothetical protein